MRMTKKITSIVLAVMMVVSLFAMVPITASADVAVDEWANIGDTFDDCKIDFEIYAVTLKGGTYKYNDQVMTDDITFGDPEGCNGADGAYIAADGSFVHGDDVYYPVDKNGNASKWYVIGKSDGDDGYFYLVLGGYDPTEPAPTAYTGLIPKSSDDATALAAKKVTFNGKPWYIIEDNSTSENEGSITLLYADTSLGKAKFDSNGSNDYSNSSIKSKLAAMTASGGDFSSVAGAIKDTDNGKMYLLSVEEAGALPLIVRRSFDDDMWWLRTAGTNAGKVAYVYVTAPDTPGRVAESGVAPAYSGGVRPALQLDLSKVDFDSENKSITVNTDVMIESLAEVNGIDLSDYYQIPAEDMYFTLGERWSSGDIRYRVDTDDNSVATKQFTINGLPKESLIFSKAYTGFRVTAWNQSTSAANQATTGKKNNLLTKIEDQFNWWESYTNFGFDVTKYVDGNFEESVKLTAADLASVSDMFRIYVPKPADVAEVNDTSYPTLADAIRAAGAGDTVNLLRNAQENVVLNAGKDIVLDLNGYTLTNDGLHSTIIAQIGSKLRVTGNGTVDNTANQRAPLFNNGGTVTLDSGRFIRSAESGKDGNTYYTVVNRGTMTINEGVTIDNDNYNYSSLIANGYNESTRTGFREIDANISFGYKEGESSASPTLTINGGTFTGGNQAFKNDIRGTAVIKGGDFSSSTGNAVYNVGELTVEGGTFTAADGKFALRSAAESGKTYGPESAFGSATVNGGTFTGTLQEDDGASVSISGGEFSTIVPENCCADGFAPKDNGDGTYGVGPDTSSPLNPLMVAASDINDGNAFGINSDYLKGTLLGVQKKNAVDDADITSESHQENGSDMRFIAVLDTELLNEADDYGFVLGKVDGSRNYTDTNINKLVDGAATGIKKISAKGTYNTVCGTNYGDPESDTPYKYVTCAVNSVDTSSKIVARFYYEKDGKTYFAKYAGQDYKYTGCMAGINASGNIY